MERILRYGLGLKAHKFVQNVSIAIVRIAALSTCEYGRVLDELALHYVTKLQDDVISGSSNLGSSSNTYDEQ